MDENGVEERAAVAYSTVHGVGELLFTRPGKRNALRPIEWKRISEIFVSAAEDPSLSCMVISGSGQAFSAGFDLRSVSVATEDSGLSTVHRALLEVYRHPKPTIAVVEGPCVGAGWALALACDLVVAAEDAYFEPPFVSRGLVPDAGIAWFLMQRIGRHETARLLWSNDRVGATEAKASGLVTQVVPTGTAMDAARETAARLATYASTTVTVSKRILLRSGTSLEAALSGDFSDVRCNSAAEDVQGARAQFMAMLGKGGADD